MTDDHVFLEDPPEDAPEDAPADVTSLAESGFSFDPNKQTSDKSDFVMQDSRAADSDDVEQLFTGTVRDDDHDQKTEGIEPEEEEFDDIDSISEGEEAEGNVAVEGEEVEVTKVEEGEGEGTPEEPDGGEAWGQGEEPKVEVPRDQVSTEKEHDASVGGAPKSTRKRFSSGGQMRGSSDFGMMRRDSGLFGGFARTTSFGSVAEVEEESAHTRLEEEEGEAHKEEPNIEEQEEHIDRDPYYDLYKSLLNEYPLIKMKNNFLQRKMAEYFKKRKMEHVLREADRIGDAEKKYFNKLDALWELKNTNDMQRNALTTELNEMKELRNKQYQSVVTNFEAMLAREKDIGTGLIFTKTAKEIPEKFLERLLKNQRSKSNEITEMRLRFIKLRNNIEEVTAAIRAMDKIGENHTLIDYEQLKMENQNYSDKIEERDEELSKLREKCSGAIQTLAHLREKSSAMDIDILDMAENLEEAQMEKNDNRESVGQLKQERDYLRTKITQLQEESGMLTKRRLLLDMEDTLEQISNIKREVEKIEQTYADNAKALDAIKHNIKVEKRSCQAGATVPVRERLGGKKQKIYKGKPKFGYKMLEKFNVML